MKNEKGISLLETVLAIVLIGIIILGFFTLLIQSNKATVHSDTIMDATYAAQIEVENIYLESNYVTNLETLISKRLYKTKSTVGNTLERCNNYTNKTDADMQILGCSEYMIVNGVKHYFVTKNIYEKTTDKFSYELTVRKFSSEFSSESAYSFIVVATDLNTNTTSKMESIYKVGVTGQ